MTDEHLNPLREKLMKKYRFKFDAYGESPIYAATLNAYLKNPRPFLDAGIRLVPKTIRSKKIPARGYFELFLPQYGASQFAKEWKPHAKK